MRNKYSNGPHKCEYKHHFETLNNFSWNAEMAAKTQIMKLK